MPTREIVVNRNPKYPSRRTYVVKVRGDAKPEALVGRIENLVTGRQCEFQSADELLHSIASDLGSSTESDPADAPSR
jgi:hypothetical protein